MYNNKPKEGMEYCFYFSPLLRGVCEYDQLYLPLKNKGKRRGPASDLFSQNLTR